MLYLDHKAKWPTSKERSARWVGVAQSIGDALTFWIIDDQSKQLLARSVVCPFNQNLRVKWDPSLVDVPDKETATHGNDVMPNEKEVAEEETVNEPMDQEDDTLGEARPTVQIRERTTFKPTYENPGLDTTHLSIPREDGVTTRSKEKLILNNDPVPLDDSIESNVRSKKKLYKGIKYKPK